ncbi:MAG: type B DNA-directed DNA polymerase [Methanosarcinales archaeon]|nr:type B DNA-directed DNA polymerase [Methanosarcinales archaeon]
MWIFDSGYRGWVELWAKKGPKSIEESRIACPRSFYLHLKDPHPHWEMLEALEGLYGAEECRFQTVYGPREGYRVFAGRGVAEKIERQTRFQAELYNVNVRMDQRFLAERGGFPCSYPRESRFAHSFPVPLSRLEMKVQGNPSLDRSVCSLVVDDGRRRVLEGPEKAVLEDLFELVKSANPDVILFPQADLWTGLMEARARHYGLEVTFSRSGRFRKLDSRPYWSYGKVNHKHAALIPEGRILIDTEKSFTYREGGLAGVLLASRLSGLCPNLTSRFTPGTLISSYEVYEALARGMAVPFRKRDPERVRDLAELKAADRGGMIFQPRPGVYEKVHQLDFTSLYPTIIVNYNLSPETVAQPAQCRGFLSTILEPLLNLRIETKRLKKSQPEMKGLDAVLKWMLVTCFGYTGYRNAKFGQIEVHEHITGISRDLLLQVKDIAEDMGLEVLHGIVDCLWVRGGPASGFKEAVERETGILTEAESYHWIAFLPMSDGSGAYNRYFGRLSDGQVKVRGVAARRGDTPPYVRRMQMEMLQALAGAEDLTSLAQREEQMRSIGQRYILELPGASPEEMVIRRRVSRLSYTRRCAEGSAVEAFRRRKIQVAPGMEIGYVVRDGRRWSVETEWDARDFDIGYYRTLAEKAWKEVAFVFEWQREKRRDAV